MPRTKAGAGRCTPKARPWQHRSISLGRLLEAMQPAASSGKGSTSGTKRKQSESATQAAGVSGSSLRPSGSSQPASDDANQMDEDGEEDETGELTGGDGRRPKKLTSFVWEYFTKKTEIVEMDGKKYEQKWGYCNYPNCKAKYRAECNYGTTGFRNHLKTAHHVVKGQFLLKVEKDHGKDITLIQPYSLFHVEGRHTGHKLAETFTEVMVSWFVEKRLFALTLDNASSNKVAVEEIIDDLKENGNACLVCEGIFFHVRCACHILNLVARDGLSVISKTIEKIKALVLVVKGSPLQWEELMKRAAECGLDKNKSISLDVSTRWNSTYLMLYGALHYKPAFIRLKSSNRRKYANISPSEAEWEIATKICHCLKKFYDLTELLSGTSYPTANLFYRGFCEIKKILDKWCVCDGFTIREMAISMHEKFEKYWTNSSTSLVVTSFLDPRYKKKLIEFYMRKFYGDYYQAQLDELLTVIKKLYQFNATKTAKSSNTKSTVNGSSSIAADPLRENLDAELESFLYDDCGTDRVELNELDRYLAEPLLKQHPFDILAYWKINTEKYPVLSQIARDMMAIQVSTVASESAFSAAGRVIAPYRSRLDPEMVQALICSKDWIRAARKDPRYIPSIVADLEPPEIISLSLDNPLHDEDQDMEGMESDPNVMNEEDEL
ncbi:Zinc finger BED domain-containing protein DAYSLEEPER [Striga hermonthica]|uniref:Zinc finger BED domain-containing protein DAYSLEEPER n=1 Tax=Striga hermonthica TaxID=68872 RepID=A0A9N7MUK2_STRHE|nr:Zinc finger BED domain-containing protein DAYSLEEPER [Striga hermonthica]